MLEKAQVTFKNTDSEEVKEVKIDFVFDKDEQFIDYKVTLSEGYSLDENLDFAGFLANVFLQALQYTPVNEATEETKDE